ncbi:TPA: hypothetical protein NPO71_000096 [Klebsiella pneumoniae]|nr:hypothetical protein [Klebsiella pneumoniae]
MINKLNRQDKFFLIKKGGRVHKGIMNALVNGDATGGLRVGKIPAMRYKN